MLRDEYACVCSFLLWSVLLSFPLPVHPVVKELAKLFSARPPSSSFSLTYLQATRTSGGGINDQMLLSARVSLFSAVAFSHILISFV